MKDLFKAMFVCFILGGLACFGLCYASGAFMSDEEYLESHPEVLNRDNAKDYFSDNFDLESVIK